jgi:amino acid adenylation domain-containing protein
MERSLELVVALLGTLKAGAAYLPLDPGHPRERLASLLEEAGATVLLSQERLLPALPASSGETWVVGPPGPEVAAEPEAGVEPDSPAYVIYTSGSTGRPKGVMNSHRAIRNRLLWMQRRYRLEAGEGVLQKTPVTFDVSVWELFWPLLAGARLVVSRPGGHQDPGYLAHLIAQEQVTTAHFVPSMLQVFLEQRELDRLTVLRRVICSGEALSHELQQRFFARMPAGVELHNLYGPTEAAVDVTSWACSPEERQVPIGRPLANTRIHLLDRSLQPVPVGVPGELYIGGVQLARGYIGRPDLTAERFLPDPTGRERGGRLYRTGDLARWLAGGAIEYLGRMDFQVKLRGFRIEPGEIEAALLQHPGVREAVVVARTDGQAGDVRLVAYVVPETGVAPGAPALRAFLRERLPEYMVPAHVLFLDTLPLTSSGKVDRRALPRPDGQSPDPGTAYCPPRSGFEELVAGIWKEVLRVGRVGVHDNFFDLGGQSLLLIPVHARLCEQTGQDLPLITLFRYPTVASLAAHLTQSGDEDASADREEEHWATLVAGRERLSRRRDRGTLEASTQ